MVLFFSTVYLHTCFISPRREALPVTAKWWKLLTLGSPALTHCGPQPLQSCAGKETDMRGLGDAIPHCNRDAADRWGD